MKNKVEMINAKIYPNSMGESYLVGTVFNHHTLGVFEGGTSVRTSTIVKRDGDTVETQNTIYNVKSWDNQPVQTTENKSAEENV